MIILIILLIGIYFKCDPIHFLQQYIRNDPSERSEENVVIVKVRQSNEPKSFKRLFPTWDNNVWKVSQNQL